MSDSTQGRRVESTAPADPARHEPPDIRIRPIVALLAVGVLVIGGTFWLCSSMLAAFGGGSTARSDQPDLGRTVRSGPDMGADQPAILRELRRRQNARLESYEWVDESAGVARIPIERAMELLVERKGDLGVEPETAGDSDDNPIPEEVSP